MSTVVLQWLPANSQIRKLVNDMEQKLKVKDDLRAILEDKAAKFNDMEQELKEKDNLIATLEKIARIFLLTSSDLCML